MMRVEFKKLGIDENELDFLKSVYGDSLAWKDDLGGHLYMDYHAFVLSPDEHAMIVGAQNAIVRLLHKIQDILRCDERLNEWLGMPEALWKESMNKRINALTAYGRFDWMFDVKGELALLEFNAETPMGWQEALDWTLKLHKHYPKLACENFNLQFLLSESVKKSLKDQCVSEGARLCIVGDRCCEEEMETYELLKRIIDYPVAEVLIGSIHNIKLLEGYDGLDDGLYLEVGELLYPLDVLQTFYSVEWMAYDSNVYDVDGNYVKNSLQQYIENGATKFVNPVSALQLHSKGLNALIWFLLNETETLDDFKEVIYKYIPYTSFEKADINELDMSRYVRKPLNEREGSNITIENSIEGMFTLDEDEGYVFQEYVDSAVVFYQRADSELNRRFIEMKPTIGTYVVSDKFGGYFTRLAEGICSSSDATFLPTFVG
jgi:glutathionylspermidine synthase